jgi:transposase
MTVTAAAAGTVIGGADTHADTIHVAAVDQVGRELGDREFGTTPDGYRAALAFLATFGTLVVIGIEGTSSYGAGLTRAAQAAGIQVREVTRPDRARRRMRGKSDPLDAYQAAHAVLSGRADAAAKGAQVEAIRSLHIARRSAVKARTAAMNQIHHMLITAPATLREFRRVLFRSPHLLSLRGVGPSTAAQLLITAGANPDRLRSESSFAALCGAAPVPASSGKTNRHRLSRGGDRAANHALHTIALVRMTCDPRTRDYVRTQRGNGRDTTEILRRLKRALAREVFKSLTHGHTAPELADLRPTRQAKNITLTAAAHAMNTYITKITRTELGTFPDYELANRYRAWLNAA